MASRRGKKGGCGRLEIWLLTALIVLIVAVIAVALYQRFNFTGPYRVEYEGRVVDKMLTLSETQLGTRGATGLLVEGEDGRRFKVAVGRDLYDRAEVGMWIRSTRLGAELSWTKPPPARSGGQNGAGAEHPSVSGPGNP